MKKQPILSALVQIGFLSVTRKGWRVVGHETMRIGMAIETGNYGFVIRYHPARGKPECVHAVRTDAEFIAATRLVAITLESTNEYAADLIVDRLARAVLA